MRRSLYVISGLMLLATAGCVAGKAPFLSAVAETSIVSEHRERALSLEKQGEIQQALFSWQVVYALRPEDKEVQEKIASLQTLAQQKATDHYEKARDLAERGERNSALRQAVISLRYDPNRLDALALINIERSMIKHRVQSGETLTGIAEKYYHDSAKAPIIACFSDLPNETVQLAPGMLLEFPQLPISDVVQSKAATPEMDDLLAKARKEFKQEKYHKVVVLAKKIVDQKPYEQEAQFLLNKAYHAIGSEHLRKGEYSKAENVLVKISEGFPGLKEALVELGRQKRQQAEEHYRQGVKYYLKEDLAKAIREWQLALKLSPDHTRARQNIEKTQAILEKLKAVQ